MRDPSLNLALVSVPGDYAAAEALKALQLGMSVMIFSDNVPVESELEIKRAADERDLIVMGPDCGTAIVNGIPLGFANVVRRGPIGVVGASGTGTQEVTARIHELGSGVSQAIGTGGHDLAEAIGGISMLRAMRWLEDDPDTKVVVLVSKPPHPTVAAAVLAQAAGMATPVVSIFLGADPEQAAGGIIAAGSLAEAADLAVELAEGRPAERMALRVRDDARARLDELVRDRAAAPALRARDLLRRDVLLRGPAHPARAGTRRVVQHAGAGQPDARRHRHEPSSTRSSTWATTSSRRAARTR